MTPDVACLELFKVLSTQNKTFATAESLTGGMIAETFTAIPGSSAYLWGGVVSYTPDAKVRLLGVSPQAIEMYTVVSAEVAQQMVLGALSVSGADTAVAVTGVAGPGGGTESTPVGSVWIAAGIRGDTAELNRTDVRLFHFSGDRESVRKQTVTAACKLLCELIRNCS